MEWVHHVRWVDVRGSELSTAEKVRPLFGGAVLGVHRVGDGWQAEMARDAFDRSWADAATDDKIVCRPCAAWEARGNESSSAGPVPAGVPPPRPVATNRYFSFLLRPPDVQGETKQK